MDHRLFYALWPDDATRSALLALQSQLPDGRPVPADNLHLTLAFLGQQSATTLPVLRNMLAHWPDFDCALQLNKFGYFQRPRIAWIGMHEAPAPLLALRHALLCILDDEGIALPGEQGSFVPHVTLMRKAQAPPQQDAPPVIWRATRIVLAESLQLSGGVSYRVLASN
jgi:2'-5' RNA ligase